MTLETKIERCLTTYNPDGSIATVAVQECQYLDGVAVQQLKMRIATAEDHNALQRAELVALALSEAKAAAAEQKAEEAEAKATALADALAEAGAQIEALHAQIAALQSPPVPAPTLASEYDRLRSSTIAALDYADAAEVNTLASVPNKYQAEAVALRTWLATLADSYDHAKHADPQPDPVAWAAGVAAFVYSEGAS